MKYSRSILLLSFLISLPASTRAQSQVCKLRTFWVERDPFISSSWELVGTFPLTATGEHPLRKLLHHEESGMDISVGVELNRYLDKKEPRLIRLGLRFSGKPDKVFDEKDATEAESVYDKHWRLLSVSKNIEKGKRTYTFSFSCERQIAKKR
jgi:hypothetical protein